MQVMIDLKDVTITDINGIFKYCTFVHKNEIVKRNLSLVTIDDSYHHYRFKYNGKHYDIPSVYNHMIDNKYEEWRKKRHDEMLKYNYIIDELGEKYDKKRKSN